MIQGPSRACGRRGCSEKPNFGCGAGRRPRLRPVATALRRHRTGRLGAPQIGASEPVDSTCHGHPPCKIGPAWVPTFEADDGGCVKREISGSAHFIAVHRRAAYGYGGRWSEESSAANLAQAQALRSLQGALILAVACASFPMGESYRLSTFFPGRITTAKPIPLFDVAKPRALPILLLRRTMMAAIRIRF
jgi:hypothetical protein